MTYDHLPPVMAEVCKRSEELADRAVKHPNDPETYLVRDEEIWDLRTALEAARAYRPAPDRETTAYERGRADAMRELSNEYRFRMMDAKGEQWIRGWNAAFLQMLGEFRGRSRVLAPAPDRE